jgi:long-chain acyl-CoA synthetase
MPAILPEVIRESAYRFPDREALVAGELRWSYAELDGLIDAAGAAFAELGVAGRRVGVLLPNHVAFPVVLQGLLRAGASAVMMNPLYSPREAAEVLSDAGAAAVVTVEPLLPLLPRGTSAILTGYLPARLRVIEARHERTIPLRQGAAPTAAAGPDDEAVLVYTAADRGRARGARLSHRNLIANCRSSVEAMRLTPEDRVVAVLPFIHLFGQTVTLNAPLAAGACVVPVERFNPLRLLDLIEEARATVLCGVPGIFAALAAAAERRGVPRHALRVAICGGSPLPLEIGRRWERHFGLPLRQGYGLTEAGPVCLFNRVDRPNHPGTMGYPFPGVDVSIRDPSGADLPTGEVGEMCVRGENVFLGYVGDDVGDDGSRVGFFGDWLRTGDLASFDLTGVVRYRGLLKPMFTHNGFNVYPHEISRVLEEDPRIRRTLVCALPEPVKDNEIVLFVDAADATLTEDDVRSLCRQRLAVFKQPGRVYFVRKEERGKRKE